MYLENMSTLKLHVWEHFCFQFDTKGKLGAYHSRFIYKKKCITLISSVCSISYLSLMIVVSRKFGTYGRWLIHHGEYDHTSGSAINYLLLTYLVSVTSGTQRTRVRIWARKCKNCWQLYCLSNKFGYNKIVFYSIFNFNRILANAMEKFLISVVSENIYI